MQQHNQMVAAFDEIADGQLKLRLDQVLGMQLEQKHVKSAMIGRFVWELGALKHNILSEGNSPKAHLVIYLQCNEQGKRLEGWGCTTRVKITLESERKTNSWCFEPHRFPVLRPTSLCDNQPKYQTGDSSMIKNGTFGLHLAWDKLVSDFQLNSELDGLNIVLKLHIIEQIGYGSFFQLDTRLNVRGHIVLVNKFHLASYSSYFRTFFFSKWCNEEPEQEYELNDPNDNVEALQLMLAMTYPFEHYPLPTSDQIGDVLRLSDKYDLQIVNERCEKFLIADEEDKLLPLLRKLALAERYALFNLKTYCLDRMLPAHFCLHLRDSVSTYAELSDGLKAELERRMARRSVDELQRGECSSQQQQQGTSQSHQNQQEGALPPPHKRVRPRPKTPPRPNYNLPPFRFK